MWFCCPTSLFPPRKTVLFYLFRGIPLVWLSVIWKADQSEDSTPLVMVIHSVMGAWTQSFRAYSTAIREVLGKGGILLLQVLLICKDWFLDLPACRFSSHGERQLENKLQGERLKKHPPNPEDILFWVPPSSLVWGREDILWTLQWDQYIPSFWWHVGSWVSITFKQKIPDKYQQWN